MNTLKHLLLTLLFLLVADLAFAAHIVGGGITYECLGPSGNGMRYRFTMKVYRDCAGGGAGFDNPANIGVYKGTYQDNSYFDDYRINIDNVFPLAINEPDCIDNLPSLCLQEGIYIWEDVFPVSNESYFVVYQRCCRTNAIANIFTPGDIGATYYIEITPAAQQVCNNSPVFNNFPPIVICNNYPLEVDYSATDPEGDVLVYSFCAPFAGGGNILGGPGASGCDGVVPNPPCAPPFTEVPFIAPNFTASQPMGGNPVVGINPLTGIISGTPQFNGQYVVGVCVEEYRNGQLLSVTRRDFQFNVTDCDPQATALVEYDELLGPSRYAIRKCDGSTSLTIPNQSIPQANIQTFEWTFDLGGGNILQNSTDFDLPITFPGLGVYNGILVLNGGLDCGDTAFIQVELYAPLSLDLGPDYFFCQDTNILLNAGPGFSSYLWQNGSTSQSINITQSGVYYVAAIDPCGNVFRDTVTMNIEKATQLIFNNQSYCPGSSSTFDVSGLGFTQFDWSGANLSCYTCPVVTATPLVTTTYHLVATTALGCTSEGSFTLEILPIPMATYVIQFYPNETVTIGGQTYNQPDTITIPVPDFNGGCDSLNTYILELLPTALNLTCPSNQTVELPVASTAVNVNYNAPLATTDCPDQAVALTLTQGLPSGGAFPLGINTVCYQATNNCGNTATCCFNITVQDPPPPCDIKVIGCMKFELLDIRLDSIKQPRFRIRATNFCASEVNYILNELPPGIVAVTPVEGSIYTAPNSGNTYLVRNPNYSPFYSVRYRSVSPGLKNGQSDVFEHRLPQQSFPNNYIHMYAKLKNGEGYEAYLNTFYCPVQPWMGSRPEEREALESQIWNDDLSLRPNPTPGQVWVDMQAWMDKQVSLRVFNALGQEVLSQHYTVNQEWLELDMSAAPANGLYYLVVQPDGGMRATATFVLER